MVRDYDAIIIGAGMSGMAAGIRLAMFGKKVAILERHSISGGLNSYYQRGKRSFDVGLHALTNFSRKGERKRPLTKLLKQLRITYEDLALYPQSYSQISFPNKTLKFSNNTNELVEEICQNFPHQKEAFQCLLKFVDSFNEISLVGEYVSAKKVVAEIITDPELLEMIFCPLLIYGSAWENDMDISQFVIMFKSIFIEGFSRPHGGVRRIINLLLDKINEVGCELHFKMGIKKIITENGAVRGVITEKDEEIQSPKIFSSIGYPETLALTQNHFEKNPRIGRLSFIETIFHLKKNPEDYGQKACIIFYNNGPSYFYQKPETLFDSRSAVICMPNNFGANDLDEGVLRLTFIANYDKWNSLEKKVYREKKEEVLEKSIEIANRVLTLKKDDIVFKDIFTPTTIKHYTGHLDGSVYGSPDKLRNGQTEINGLYLCGTDQGFLGIVGSLLSGISMANLHGLMNE